jgi:hypothetical protein
MSNHKHEHCSHNLLYCDKCDVVYCTKCDREWGGHNHYYPYTWYWCGTPYTVKYADTGYTITCSTGETVTDPKVISAFNLQAQTGELSTACNHQP